MTEKAAAQTQLQIYERLSQLDEETQERISQKYYHGARPWNKKGNASAQTTRKK